MYFPVAAALDGELRASPMASLGSHFLWTAAEVTGSVLLSILYLQVPSIVLLTFVLPCFPMDVWNKFSYVKYLSS